MSVKNKRMKTLKQYRYVLSAILALTALVLIRAHHPGIFRYNAVKWAEPSVTGENIITTGEILSADEKILIVKLDASCQAPDVSGASVVSADPHAILEGDYFRKVRKNRGPVVLCSDDVSVSARVWKVLSEMGIRKLYILKKDPA